MKLVRSTLFYVDLLATEIWAFKGGLKGGRRMLIFVYFFVAGICGLIGASMAESRSRSSLGWGLASFSLGPLALVILAVAGTVASEIDLRKWQALLEVDSDIAAAAAKVRELGPAAERALAQKYLALNDKSYLPTIVQSVIDNAPKGPREGTIGKAKFRILDDGSYVVVTGRFVGRSFPDFDTMKATLGG